MPVAGAIAERARGILPVTWDALAADQRYGDGLLQSAVSLVKENVFGVVVAPDAEAAYKLIVIDYAAKLVVLELIPAGVDFWMNEPMSESATGTNENHTFVDRAGTLRELGRDLLIETRRIGPDIAVLVGFRRVSSKSVPKLSTMDDEFLTPSHQEFPRPYSATERS